MSRMQPIEIPDAFDDLCPTERQGIEKHNYIDRTQVRVEHLIQFHCLACNGAVPKEMVCSHDPAPLCSGPSRRTYNAYCEHCDLLHEVDCVLLGGVWTETGATTIRDAKRIRSHFAQVRTRMTPARKIA
jgi:hypothetical protein